MTECVKYLDGQEMLTHTPDMLVESFGSDGRDQYAGTALIIWLYLSGVVYVTINTS